MGSFEPEITPIRNVTQPQFNIQKLVEQQLRGLLGGEAGPGATGAASQLALLQLLGGAPTDFSGIESAAFRRFDREVAPRINTGFAGIGGSLSSRKATETSRALGDLQGQLAGVQTGLIESARGRQLQAIQAALQPLQIGAGFSTQNTLENLASESPLSSGIRQGLQTGGLLGSAAILK